jgi:predicted anti-sigma-YlaC factor YlaD
MRLLGWQARTNCDRCSTDSGNPTVKCHELLVVLNDFVDGDAPSILCRAIQEHLTHCDSCRVVIDTIRQTIVLYRAEERLPMPAELHEKIRSLMHDQWTLK